MKKKFILAITFLTVVFFNIGISEKVEATVNDSNKINLVESVFDPISCSTSWKNGGNIQLDHTDKGAVRWSIGLDRTSVKSFQGTMVVRPLRGGRVIIVRMSGKTGETKLNLNLMGRVSISIEGRALGEDGVNYSTVFNSLSI
ncbi:hypothetical protein [Enterococcus sp. AZ126]|uniref:hypothetical protein n=1 Tax=Enterococcus sp. AZ126 TaxID=2774635 RepID=UPI003F22A442